MLTKSKETAITMAPTGYWLLVTSNWLLVTILVMPASYCGHWISQFGLLSFPLQKFLLLLQTVRH
jgi:hypothetical protein